MSSSQATEPEFSRKAALVIQSAHVLALPVDEQFALRDAFEEAGSIDALPEHLRPLFEGDLHTQIVEAQFEERLHPRGRGGRWMKKVLDAHIARVGPYAYHLTSHDNVDAILKHGLRPGMPSDSPSSVGLGQPRAGHVYLSVPTKPEYARFFDAEEHPIRVDLRKLDPKKIVADEDHGLDKHPHLYHEDHTSWGELADRHADVMADPDTVKFSLEQGSLAVEGAIPPAAIERNPGGETHDPGTSRSDTPWNREMAKWEAANADYRAAIDRYYNSGGGKYQQHGRERAGAKRRQVAAEKRLRNLNAAREERWRRSRDPRNPQPEYDAGETHDPGTPKRMSADEFAAIYDGFEHDGMKLHTTQVVEQPGLVVFHGDVFEGATHRGSVETTYHYGKDPKYIEHALIVLKPDAQERGWSRAFHQHLYKEYPKNGVHTIALQAIDVGGYAWAREGFDLDWERAALTGVVPFMGGSVKWDYFMGDETFGRAIAMRGLYELRMLDPDQGGFAQEKVYGNVPEKLWVDFLGRFPTREQITTYVSGQDQHALDGTWKSPQELATFGREHTWVEAHNDAYKGAEVWLGKRFLLGSGWRGVKTLEGDKVQEATLGKTLAQIAGEVSAERKLSLPPDSLDDDGDFWDEVLRRAGS